MSRDADILWQEGESLTQACADLGETRKDGVSHAAFFVRQALELLAAEWTPPRPQVAIVAAAG